MTTISSTVVKLRIHKKRESAMSPLYSVELLSGVATQMTTGGTETPFVGSAVLWISDPSGALTQNTIACSAPNGAWKYFNQNSKTGTWKATLHIPAGTGTVASVSPDYTWEVDSSVATSQ